MTQPTDKELNRVLADVAGISVEWSTRFRAWFYKKDDYRGLEWYPLTDANHMQLVKAGLTKEHGFTIHYIEMRGKYECRIWKDGVILSESIDASELRAIALAVYAMKKDTMYA